MTTHLTEVDSAELAETIAYTAIRRLQHRYADAITRRAWADLDAILAEDCTLSLDLGDQTRTVDGRASIAAFISSAVERFSFFEFALLSTVIEIDGDEAHSRLWMAELRQNADDGRRTTAFGVYHDRLVRSPSGWRFVERRYASVSRTAEPDHPNDQLVFNPPMLDLDGWS